MTTSGTPTVDRLADVQLDPPESYPRILRLALAAIFVGVLTVVFAGPLAEIAAGLLPGRAEISSRGTDFEPFSLVAPTILRRTGLVLLAVGVSGTVALRWAGRLGDAAPRSGKIAASLVAAGTAFWYGWLAAPHNGYLTNARFHWVDYLTWDSSRFTYAAGRIPHLLFYEYPYVWQGISAAIVVLLLYLIARRLDFSTWAAAVVACIPAISGNLLLFATSAEDVMLNTALLLFVVWALLRGQSVLIGVAIGLAVLGRPSFMILIPCVFAAELVTRLRNDLWAVSLRRSMIAPGVAVAIVVVEQLAFDLLGDRYLLVDGRIVRNDMLDMWVPRAIEGFTIFPHSGVYALHLLWIIPAVLIVMSAAAVITARGQAPATAVAIYTSVLFVVLHILAHETKPLGYYNTRYLAFVFPFFLFMSLAVLAHRRFPAGGAVRVMTISLVVLGTAVLPADPISAKRWVEARPETILWSERDALREIADDRYVFLDFGDAMSRNYLAYVLRRDLATIRLVGDSGDQLVRTAGPGRDVDVGPDDLVISRRSDPWSSDEPDLEIGEFIIFEVDADHT